MWVNGPVGLGAEGRVLRPGCRSVLVVVPFVVAGTRLMDVLPLLEADHRLMTVFTVAPAANGANCHGVEEFLRTAGGLVIPWAQAVQTEFDIILATSATGVAQLRGTVVMLPHGAGAVPARRRALARHTFAREELTCSGRVMPSLLVLSHDAELAELEAQCPEVRDRALVAGDIVYDRLVASVPFRDRYRDAFGLRDNQQLVVLSSTWGPESAFGRYFNLADRLVAELNPGRYRVAVALHPNIWSVHGEFQVRAWLADALCAGLLLLPPEEGWRAALVAADVLIGDHGSVTRYGAALGRRLLLTPAGSAGLLGSCASRLRPELPLTDQVATARREAWQADLGGRLTSHPGRAGQILRRALYRLLDLPEPARAVPVSPVPLPNPITAEPRFPGRPDTVHAKRA